MFFDNSLERTDYDAIISCFTDDCRIHDLGKTLFGRSGVEKWLNCMFEAIEEVKSTPVTIVVDGNVFSEEFEVTGKTKDGLSIKAKQQEVLLYED